MVAPSWSIAYLCYLAFIVGVQVAVCEQPHPEVENNVFTDVLGLATGTYCAALWPQVQFILFLTVTIPGVLLLYSLVAPLWSASVGGLIAGGLSLLLLGGFLVGIV